MMRKRVQFLYGRYTQGLATEDEWRELKSLLADRRYEHDVAGWLDGVWENMDDVSLSDMPAERREAVLSKITAGGQRPRRIRGIMAWTAAAAVVIASCVLLYESQWQQDPPAEMISLTQPGIPDIDPGTDKAVLTLADGQQVVLDGTEQKHMLLNHSVQISKVTGNTLVYLPSGLPELRIGASLAYHTLRTPAGGQYQVMLPDGTKVVLNASSRLRYPQRFSFGERRVEFEGEGYFEVASDPSRPFVVTTEKDGLKQDVRVLGTEFNINTYDHGPAVVTTVVGGRVAVRGEQAGEVTLEAGQQAVYAEEIGQQPVLHSKQADINEVLAWKEGLFLFNNEPLPSLLNRVARWYDVTFVYDEELGDIVFQGNYFRNKGLLNLLENLEETGRVQFKADQTYTDERRIYVMKK